MGADEQEGRDGRSWGDQLRELAARTSGLADSYQEAAQALRELDTELTRVIAADAGLLDAGLIADVVEATAYRLRTAQWVHAEAARAYDAMLAAGGPGNREVYAQYAETMRMLTGLLPDHRRDGLGS